MKNTAVPEIPNGCDVWSKWKGKTLWHWTTELKGSSDENKRWSSSVENCNNNLLLTRTPHSVKNFSHLESGIIIIIGYNKELQKITLKD